MASYAVLWDGKSINNSNNKLYAHKLEIYFSQRAVKWNVGTRFDIS
jgi:hypothetical protein